MSLTVGKLAMKAGVGIETIRFYERRGLLDPPPRRPSGYRIYPEGTVPRLQFIRRAQQLGFTLNEIRDLIALDQDKTADCGVLLERTGHKIATIEQKIADLQRMKNALQELEHSCQGGTPIRECPIMDCLSGRAVLAS
jgi:MerR family transcriptional regulator, copper efflux regulator